MPVHTRIICFIEFRYLRFPSGNFENLLLCILEKDREFFDENALRHLPKFQVYFIVMVNVAEKKIKVYIPGFKPTTFSS